jgi:fibronectin-binding autotransporter adhesin
MKPKFRNFLILAGGSLLAISYAHAADGIWTADVDDGTWSDTANWDSANVADGADFTATFDNVITANRNVILDSSRTIGNVTAADTSHNYTISGSIGTEILTLDRTDATKPTISVPSNRTLTISSVIAGGDGLLKTGNGDFSPRGLNTFTGGVDLAAGRITITNNDNEASFLGDPSNTLTFSGNAELYNVDGQATLPQGITINDGITGRVTGAFGERTQVNSVLAGSGTLVVQGYSAGYDAEFLNTGNTFTGPIEVRSGDGVTLGMASLVDSANTIGLQSNSNNGGIFEYMSGASAPLVLDNRQFELIVNGNAGTNTGRQPGIKNNAATANTITVNTDLLFTATGNKNFILGGGNSGDNAFNGLLADKVVDVPDPDPDIVYSLSILKQDGGKWILGNVNNSYTGSTNISGRLEVTKLADGGTNSGIGASTNDAANLVLNNGAVLRYTGSGDSTNRAFSLAGTNNNHTFSFDSSGSGAVSFTNAATPGLGTSNQTRTVKLIGTNTGDNTFAATLADNGTSSLSLTKEGAGKWIVTGDSTYSGATTVTAGTLLVSGDQSLATGAVNVNGTSTFGGSGTVGGDVNVAAGAKLAPGASVGTLNIGGNLTISAMAGDAGVLDFELGTLAASDKIAVTGTLDIGTDVLGLGDFNFTNVGGLQEGVYALITSGGITGTLDANDLTGSIGATDVTLGTSGNNIILTVGTPSGTPYENWATGGELFGDDSNGDGVSNGMAFLLGAPGPDANALGLLPTVTETSGGLVMSFSMLDAASRGTATLSVEHSNDLGISDAWTTVAVPDSSGASGGVTFVVSGSGTLDVEATIGSGEAGGGKLFGRLKAGNP